MDLRLARRRLSPAIQVGSRPTNLQTQ